MKIFANIESIIPTDITELKDRRIQERSQIDYKGNILPLNDKNKFELLKDVSAMANSEGGVIIYGVEQDESGAPIEFPGVPISDVDDLHNRIDNILNDNLDERIPGIKHKAIPRDDGTHFYIIQIPRSHLAPHMITMAVNHPRFYMRVNTMNAPMNVRQIKDISLRIERAEGRALNFIKERFSKNIPFSGPSYIFHIVPLYSNRSAIDLTKEEVIRSLVPLGTGNPIHTVHGYLIEYVSDTSRKHVLVTRNGAVEKFKTLLTRASPNEGSSLIISGTRIEKEVIDFAKHVARHQLVGLAELPALLSLSLRYMRGVGIYGMDGFPTDIVFSEEDITPEPILLYDWSDLDTSLKYFFDIIWQAFGCYSSPNYDKNGIRFESQ